MVTAARCTVCRRREAPVCDICRHRMLVQLAMIPDLIRELPYALVPTSGGGERVSATREAPLPVRLDALNLTAAGNDDTRGAYTPKIQVSSTVIEVEDESGATTSITVWDRQGVVSDSGYQIMILVDDQTGALPITAWLGFWIDDWSREFGHHALPPTRPAAASLQQPALSESPPDRTRAKSYTLSDTARVLLGLGPALPYPDRPEDPLAEEWTARWGERPVSMPHRLAWLIRTFDHACHYHPRMADFAASLRTMVGALQVATGAGEDLEYLGRCPELITDPDTSLSYVCGAEIWYDLLNGSIVCPRCHAETDYDQRLGLARRILETWPLDRRRRYPKPLIRALTIPACPCGAILDIEWLEATECRDVERFWRIGRVTCPGCQGEPRI